MGAEEDAKDSRQADDAGSHGAEEGSKDLEALQKAVAETTKGS